MQAIQTKYIPPTNHRDARIKATCSAGSVTVDWHDGKNPEENHKAAALALIAKLGWQSYPPWYRGGLDDGGCVFVCAWDSERLQLADDLPDDASDFGNARR